MAGFTRQRRIAEGLPYKSEKVQFISLFHSINTSPRIFAHTNVGTFSIVCALGWRRKRISAGGGISLAVAIETSREWRAEVDSQVLYFSDLSFLESLLRFKIFFKFHTSKGAYF